MSEVLLLACCCQPGGGDLYGSNDLSTWRRTESLSAPFVTTGGAGQNVAGWLTVRPSLAEGIHLYCNQGVSPGFIASRWDGVSWQSVGQNFGGGVQQCIKLASLNTFLYALRAGGGAGGSPSLWRFEGALDTGVWVQIALPVGWSFQQIPGTVYGFDTVGGALYMSPINFSAPPISVRVASYNGTAFQQLGGIANPLPGGSGFILPRSFAGMNGEVFAGGAGNHANLSEGAPIGFLRLIGTEWEMLEFDSTLGAQNPNNIHDLWPWNGNLYAVGSFNTIHGTDYRHIFAYSGSSLSTVETGFPPGGVGSDAFPHHMIDFGDHLYVYGKQNKPDELPLGSLASLVALSANGWQPITGENFVLAQGDVNRNLAVYPPFGMGKGTGLG